MLHPDRRLVDAVRDGDLAGVRAALADGADVQAYRSGALGWAATQGYLEIVECLLSAGADVHAEESFAICAAAGHGHLDVVQCFLNAGADLGDGRALLRAVVRNHPAVATLLLAHATPVTALVKDLHNYAPAVQVSAIGLVDLPVADCARAGICPEALCALLQRQGREALAATLRTTQMLEPLDPDERGVLLLEMLDQRYAGVAAVCGAGKL